MSKKSEMKSVIFTPEIARLPLHGDGCSHVQSLGES
jgi:hypothetical protein